MCDHLEYERLRAARAVSTLRRSTHGQSLVEFALVLPIFLLLVMGIIDGGRAIFAFNQMSQASRDVARVASVTCFQTTPRCSTANGTPIKNAINVQAAGAQGAPTWTVQCIDANTQAVVAVCAVGNTVRVNVKTTFNLIFGPLQAAFGAVGVESTSEQQILQ